MKRTLRINNARGLFTRSRALALCALGLLSLAGGSGWADQIRTKDGRVIEGVITATQVKLPGSGDEAVKIRVGAAEITLPQDKITSITTASASENAVISARDQLKGHQAAEAVKTITTALDQQAKPEQFIPVLVEQGDELAKAIPAMDEPTRQGLSRILAGLETVQLEKSEDLLARRLQLHLCLGEGDKANALFELLGQDYLKENETLRKQLTDLLQKSLDTLTEAGEFTRAEATLENLKKIDPELAKARQMAFYIQWGSHEREAGRYEQALEVYRTHLVQDSPLIARDRIELTLTEAERKFREQNQLPEAARLMETYGLPSTPEFARKRLIQIWRDEGWQRIWRHEYPEARAAFEQAEKTRKGSAKTDLAQLEYRERKAKLTGDDLLGHYNLGVWCMKEELTEPALAEFRVASPSKAVGASAKGFISQITNKMAESELSAIMDQYQAGEYTKVLSAIHEFMGKNYPTGYLAQAKEIEDMTQESIKMRVSARPQQAEALFQRAQRSFYQGRYAEADSLMTTLNEHYRDTVVYARTKPFQALVKDKLELAKLEQGQMTAKQAKKLTEIAKVEDLPDSGTITNAIDDSTSGTVTNAADEATSGTVTNAADEPTSGTVTSKDNKITTESITAAALAALTQQLEDQPTTKTTAAAPGKKEPLKSAPAKQTPAQPAPAKQAPVKATPPPAYPTPSTEGMLDQMLKSSKSGETAKD